VNGIKDKIYIYDVFTELYSPYQLTPNELYLFCFLYTKRNHEYKLLISIELIHQAIPIKLHNSRPGINRSRIKETLLTLREKGVINFDIDEAALNKKNGKDILIHITFEKINEESGYELISYNNFYSANNIYHFYIIMAVKRFDNVKYMENGLYGRWISEKEFAKLLNVGEDTLRKNINELLSQKRLFKLTGSKGENTNERDKNRYRTIPFPKDGKDSFENRHDGNKKRMRKGIKNKNQDKEHPF
jgi:hypothetical protein